jgi:hypothetical protein
MTLVNAVSGTVYSKGLPAKDRIQLYGMAALFLVLLYNSPSGLVLYWTCNNIFSLGKNCYSKIKTDRKSIVLNVLLSGLLILFAAYVMLVHRGSIRVRTIIAAFSCFTAAVLWIVYFARKHFNENREYIKLAPKDSARIFCFSCLCLWALSGLVTPSLLIASSPGEFSFIDAYKSPLFFLFNTSAQALGFFAFWPICLYSLFPVKVKKLLAVLFAAAAVSAVCNVFLFPGDYGLISVMLEFSRGVGHGTQSIFTNLLLLIFITAAVVFFMSGRSAKIMAPAFAVCFSAFIVMSLMNIVKIQQSYTKVSLYRGDDNAVKEVRPIFHLSRTGKNVVIIMIDRAISVFVPHILDESPELRGQYGGFVYYPNTVSFNGYTRIGAPPIFGGYEYAPLAVNGRTDVPLKQKHNEALLMLPRLFSDAGYSVTATDSPYANYTDPPDMGIYDDIPNTTGYITDGAYTDIWVKENGLKLPSVSDTLKRSLFWYALLRLSPYILREGLYQKGDWCSANDSHRLTLTLNGYAVLDYLPALTGFDAATENTALLFVNNATHENSFLQAPDYVPVSVVTNYGKAFGNSSAYHVNAAAIKRLASWFEYLKENDVYDNTRIIIVSDHGPEPNFLTKLKLPFNIEQYNPLLMVKDFNSAGEIQTDNTFMSNADVPALALKDLIDDPRNPFTGNAINMDAKQKPLYVAMSGSIHITTGEETQILLDPQKDYYVHGNIFEPANWEKAAK